jgi:hypothetical protein
LYLSGGNSPCEPRHADFVPVCIEQSLHDRLKPATRITVNVVSTVAIALGVVRILGGIPFAPWATDLLIRLAAAFGMYGDEQVEDVYMIASLLIAFAFAAALVWAANRLVARRRS